MDEMRVTTEAFDDLRSSVFRGARDISFSLDISETTGFNAFFSPPAASRGQKPNQKPRTERMYTTKSSVPIFHFHDLSLRWRYRHTNGRFHWCHTSMAPWTSPFDFRC